MAGAIRSLMLPLVTLLAGIGAGGGAAVATRHFLGPPSVAKPVAEATVFVPAPKILIPLVFGDGQLAGYASFDAQLQVTEEASAGITARLPLLLDAINMRTYHTPLAAGPDGLLPDLASLRTLVAAAAAEAFGAHAIRKIAITRVEPA